VLIVTAVSACGPRADNSRVKLSPPVENTALGPGDVFLLQIVGEKDLPQEYQVDSDGEVDIPYAHRVHVGGLEPQEVAAYVRKKLIKAGVLTDPSVIVRVEQWNSKHITILGQVQKPGSIPFSNGISLIQAISMAGGFNAVAKTDRVNLTRKTKTGTESVVISVDAITDGISPDIPLQAGDQIYVQQRVF
jgi:polysaccharide export outer membrane protein